ncbi:hypothetical protein FEM48_Zijuj06G0199000 [Ziziphus jujuba var. spinosa]|uniref:Pentatricopeptide repeat-containing protein n=1 Tax=Ziziphus jujuba var. spinosa TaxID=714518 RepID=A0A978VBA7_ZIZJJ|nr:hypothetical protein FEM48_Zijuj06G0199000 [Ziziphus jujuba var. spinosa]
MKRGGFRQEVAKHPLSHSHNPRKPFCSSTTASPSPPSWSYLIRKSISQGSPKQALLIYTQIRSKGICNLGVVPLILKACASLCFVNFGKALHGERMSKRTTVTWIEMIDGFARNGDTISARRLFDRVPSELKNVVTWSVMVDGYCSNGEMEAARDVFEQMPQRNFFAWSSMISGNRELDYAFR